MSELKTAEDKYQNKLQFGHLNTAVVAEVTTAAVWDASFDRHIIITPVSADARIEIRATAVTPTTAGFLIKLGGSYTTIIRKGEYLGASATVNVVELGEL
jgi:hypothetical protein